jgi:hypothetical protein
LGARDFRGEGVDKEDQSGPMGALQPAPEKGVRRAPHMEVRPLGKIDQGVNRAYGEFYGKGHRILLLYGKSGSQDLHGEGHVCHHIGFWPVGKRHHKREDNGGPGKSKSPRQITREAPAIGQRLQEASSRRLGVIDPGRAKQEEGYSFRDF